MIWDIPAPKFPQLDGDITCDTLVIGGGMCGLLCARSLQKSGIDTVLVEGNELCSGITRKTTAVVTAQHDTLYSKLIKSFGDTKAKQYLNANLWAVEQFRELSTSIACDFEDKPSVIYSTSNSKKMKDEVCAVQSLGFNAKFITSTPLPVNVVGGVEFPNMGQFHPLKFAYGIARNLKIFEHTFVKSIKKTTAFTDCGNITAKRIVIAAHYPFINRSGMYFMKLFQMRSYVIALENAEQIDGTYVDNENGFYFRNYKDLLLVGGGDKRTGKKGCGFKTLREFTKKYYPEAVEKYSFATQDCISLDGVPYIGHYGDFMPNVYVATGFNEWGMTSSMVSSRILKELILNEKSEFCEVFSPQRNMLKKQLFINLGITLGNFVLPKTKRCSHLGCALKYNKEEDSWDCFCHGSRFEKDGKLIDNPAMKDSNV